MTGTKDPAARCPLDKVLVVCDPTSDEDDLVAFAAGFVRERHARAVLFTVVEPPEDLKGIARFLNASDATLRQSLLEGQASRLRSMLNRVAPGFDAEVQVAAGKPFIEIIRAAAQQDVDLVLKAAEVLDSRLELFASTDQHLMRKCPCPVWLIRDGDASPVRTVLAPVDVGDPMFPDATGMPGLNERILEMAGHVADDGGIVHVLHVWDAPGESLVRSLSGASDPGGVAARYVEETWARHRRALDRLVEEVQASVGSERQVTFLPRLQRGAPRHAIPADVAALGADVLVMGTIARAGVRGFLIGNTAEDVLNSVRCSVVTVKPPGYVSPIS